MVPHASPLISKGTALLVLDEISNCDEVPGWQRAMHGCRAGSRIAKELIATLNFLYIWYAGYLKTIRLDGSDTGSANSYLTGLFSYEAIRFK